MTKKTYVVDTNILLSDPEALFAFEENDVVLPLIVIEELDRHKDRQDEVGRNARETVRKIAGLTKVHKNLNLGIPLGNQGGTLRILSAGDFGALEANLGLPLELSSEKITGGKAMSGDNSIISLCRGYIAAHPEEKVVLVSKDTLLRIKCNVLGIECEDYRRLQATSSVSKLYSGVKTIEIEFDVDEAYRDKEVMLTEEELDAADLYPNQFVILTNKQDGRTAMARFISRSMPLYIIEDEMKVGKLLAKNKEQRFALDLLSDPEIKLVTIAGHAGTGKTLISLASGLEQTLEKKRYKSLVVIRPIQPLGKDVGFLPGSLAEKLEPWIAPIKDNLRFLLSNSGKRSKGVEEALEMYFEDGIIEIEAMTFIRGRSISNAFIIIDESQNLNVHELKTIITRVGEGTKIVLTGDIEQIDNSYVDSLSNGLTVAIEKFKDQPIAGHVTLTVGERSELASLAAKVLG